MSGGQVRRFRGTIHMCHFKQSRTVVVVNQEGVHARAATLIAELVRGFEVKVEVIKGHERVEAVDVLQLLSLGAQPGEELLLEADGRDAEAALDKLAQLFASCFDVDGS